MALIPKPQFPNVPKLPGVPQLSRSLQFPAAPAAALGLGLALGKLWQSIFAETQWAVYRALKPKAAEDTPDGIATVPVVAQRTPVIVPDSFGEFAYRNKQTVSDFPVQKNAFASYNKVASPYEISLRLYKGGTKAGRKRFLDSILAIVGDTELYDILTPEKTFLSVNVTDFEIMRRGEKGAYFFAEVDLYFREIREVVATYTNTAIATDNAQDPSAAPVSNAGVIQAVPVTLTGPPF
jgi:hypothetical protein